MILLGLVSSCTLKKPQLFQHRENELNSKDKLDRTFTSSGEFTRYSEAGPRVPLWTIRWKEAELKYDSNGKAGGTMKHVSGVIYDQGKPASRFVASNGRCTVTDRNLMLFGGVSVEHSSPPSKLTCDTVEWNPDLETMEARGTVYVTAESFQFGPMEKLIASPSLQEISTPNLASKKNP